MPRAPPCSAPWQGFHQPAEWTLGSAALPAIEAGPALAYRRGCRAGSASPLLWLLPSPTVPPCPSPQAKAKPARSPSPAPAGTPAPPAAPWPVIRAATPRPASTPGCTGIGSAAARAAPLRLFPSLRPGVPPVCARRRLRNFTPQTAAASASGQTSVELYVLAEHPPGSSPVAGCDHPGRQPQRRHRLPRLAGRAAELIGAPTGMTMSKRRGWDSNPRTLAGRRFSRPEPSTTRPPLQGARRKFTV